MASGIYNRAKYNMMSKVMNLAASGDAIRVMLLTSSHAFTAAHNQKSEIVANEIANGNGYVTNGALLANQSVTQAATTKFDGDDTAWTSASFTAAHAVLYDDTLANDDLIASFDFGGDKTVSNGTFTIQWHANGILTLTS
jgi:hypothetical protein